MPAFRGTLQKEAMKHDNEGGLGAPKEARMQQALQLLAAIFYGSCAVGMNFVNKAAISVFPLTNVLLLNQMILAFIIISSARALNIVSYPSISRRRAVSVLPVTVLYVANVAFSLLSLSSLNIVFYSSLKRLTPIVVLVIKAAFTGKAPPQAIILSVSLIVGGCILLGIGDFDFNLKGYAYVLTSCMLQASYLLLVEYNGEAKQVGTSELMVYNALWSIPALIIVVLLNGEADSLALAIQTGRKQIGAVMFAAMLVGCGTFGMVLNFSQFLCTMINSALTTTITGVLKVELLHLLRNFFAIVFPFCPPRARYILPEGVAATVLGLLFYEVRTGFLNLSGICLNTVGGVWYTVAKYRQRTEKLSQ